MTPLQLAPSILTADFSRIGDEIRSVADIVDWFHLDVMDGHYVPNITFGTSVVMAVRASCDNPLHVHLMIDDPLRYAPAFIDAGADRVSFHPEVTPDSAEVIAAIREAGAGAGIAVHPDVDLIAAEKYLDELDVLLIMTVRPGFGGQSFLPEVLPKIGDARRLVDGGAGPVDVEIDGGVNLSTLERAAAAGGDIFVAGSAIFDGSDAPAAARRLRSKLDELEARRG